MVTAFSVVGLLGTALIIGVAQFVFVPLDTPAMSALDAFIGQSETARDMADKLGNILVFRERKSLASFREAHQIALPAVAPPSVSPLAPTAVAAAKRLLPPPSSEGPNWGVVSVHEARTFTLQGKSRSRLGAGTALAVLSEKKTSVGDCLECTVFPAGPSQAAFLILKKDLMMFGGTPDVIPETAQNLLVDKAKTLADMDKFESDAEKAALMKNPYYTAYQAARADYIDYWKRVKALQQERDSGHGDSQVRAEDALRQLKGEDIRVGEAYKKSKATYEEWQRLNPGRPISDHPGYRTLRAKLDSLDEQLAALPPTS